MSSCWDSARCTWQENAASFYLLLFHRAKCIWRDIRPMLDGRPKTHQIHTKSVILGEKVVSTSGAPKPGAPKHWTAQEPHTVLSHHLDFTQLVSNYNQEEQIPFLCSIQLIINILLAFGERWKTSFLLEYLIYSAGEQPFKCVCKEREVFFVFFFFCPLPLWSCMLAHCFTSPELHWRCWKTLVHHKNRLRFWLQLLCGCLFPCHITQNWQGQYMSRTRT